jgi:hypothetical protein
MPPTFLATWDTPLDAAAQTAIQSVMDYVKKHSVPVEEYYASKRLVYDRDGFSSACSTWPTSK